MTASDAHPRADMPEPSEVEALRLVRMALHSADDVSSRIVKGGYRANLSDTEDLRNHVRRLAAALVSCTEAVAVEREACAQAAERFLLAEDGDGYPVLAADTAATIRARSAYSRPTLADAHKNDEATP